MQVSSIQVSSILVSSILVSFSATEVIRENEKRSRVLLFECTLPGFCMHAAGRDEQPGRRGAGRGPADRQLGQSRQNQWSSGRAERYLRLPGQREGQVVRDVQVDCLGKLRTRLQSRHAIEDVRQETFARVFAVLRKEGGLKNPERLGAFVNSVCNNVLFETYRSSGRVESLDLEDRPEPRATGPDALAIVSARQMSAKVREILLDMAPRDRFLLKAVFLEQRDREEVCREFGVDREYLRVLLHRAKQEFKTEYVKRHGGPVPLDAGA